MNHQQILVFELNSRDLQRNSSLIETEKHHHIAVRLVAIKRTRAMRDDVSRTGFANAVAKS